MEFQIPSGDRLLAVPTHDTPSKPSLSKCSSFAAARLWQCRQRAFAISQKYRAVTLSEAYLTSTASGRPLWRAMLPIFAIGVWLGEWLVERYFHLERSYTRLIALSVWSILLLAASRMKCTSLLPDFFIVVAAALFNVGMLISEPSFVYHQGLYGINQPPLQVIIFGALGVRSWMLALFTGATLALVNLNPRGTPLEAFTVTWFLVMCQLVIMALQFAIASLLVDLQIQLETSRHLLDNATDGFCSLNRDTLTIVTASPGLADTFGCLQLVGSRLSDFVAQDDKHKILFDAMPDQLGRVNHSSVLVTCHYKADPSGPPTWTFDARISQYASSEGELSFFLKVLGEFRKNTDRLDVGMYGNHHGDNSLANGQNIEDCSQTDILWESATQVWNPLELIPENEDVDEYGKVGRDIRRVPLVASSNSQVLPLTSASLVNHTKDHSGEYDAKSMTSLSFTITNSSAQGRKFLSNVACQTMNGGVASELVCDASCQTPELASNVLSEAPVVEAPTHARSQHPRLGKPPELPHRGLAQSKKRGTTARRSRIRLNTSKRVLPNFECTPDNTVGHIVKESMFTINFRGQGCCAFHIGATHFEHHVRELLRSTCHSDFCPHTGWQCTACFAMNECDEDTDKEDKQAEGEEEEDTEQEANCVVCGEARTQRPAALHSDSGSSDAS